MTRERYDYDREDMLRQALEAWRVNPLARRIVELTTQYVVGGGMRLRVDHPYTHKFIEEFWNHRLNQLGMRVYELCDELTRAGELFIVVSTDAAGMSYIRAIPAVNIEEITCADNDLAQEQSYLEKAVEPGEEPRTWRAYNELEDHRSEDGSFPRGDAALCHQPAGWHGAGGKRSVSGSALALDDTRAGWKIGRDSTGIETLFSLW